MKVTIQRRKPLFTVSAILTFAFVLVASLFAYRQAERRRSSLDLSRPDLSRAKEWSSFGGRWDADGVEIRNSSEERGAKLIAHAGEWKDFQVSGDIQIVEPYGEAGVILRSRDEEEGVDAYHGYFLGIRTMDSSMEIGRADFGWRSLAHVPFKSSVDSRGWFHLHAVAVGCRVALQVTSPNGESISAAVSDDHCIRSGSFGLRSSNSSAKWKSLRVAPANEGDLAPMETSAARVAIYHDLLLSEPQEPTSAARYIAAMRDEAAKHEVHPGITPISYFRFSPGRHANVTFQGEVISLPPLLDIQDSTGTIIIPNVSPTIPLQVGDYVEAHGTLISEQFRSRLEDATIRPLWSDLPFPPLAVTAAQLTAGTYRGRFIEVEGTLISTRQLANGYELILKDGNQTFRALGQVDLQFRSTALTPGSRLRLRGNATSLDQFTNGIYPFTVISDRVDVVSAPPWWSPVHVLWLALGCLLLLSCTHWVISRIQAWHMHLLLREREELSFEMHDTLAQSFTGIAYQLQAAIMETRGVAEVHTHVQNALKMVNLSHREASRTIAALRPQNRKASDIVAALKELAERLSDRGLMVKAQVEGKDVDLPLAVTDALFRIGQEAVTNAVQHAGCTLVEINLQLAREQVRMAVRDNGKGILPDGQSSGLGIAGMRGRAAKIKASFNVVASASGGTSIDVVAPLVHSRGLFSDLHGFLTTIFPRRYLH